MRGDHRDPQQMILRIENPVVVELVEIGGPQGKK
jgi:hypothetical protein